MPNPNRNPTLSRSARAANVALTAMAVVLSLLAATSAASAPALPGWRQTVPFSTESATLTVGGSLRVDAEIADTEPLRERGLGFRDGLRAGWGMLFVYENASRHTFWMKGMRFCLDIIWIEAGQIQGAAESLCPVPGAADANLPRYDSPGAVTYILEMPAGWMSAHGFKQGTAVDIGLAATG